MSLSVLDAAEEQERFNQSAIMAAHARPLQPVVAAKRVLLNGQPAMFFTLTNAFPTPSLMTELLERAGGLPIIICQCDKDGIPAETQLVH